MSSSSRILIVDDEAAARYGMRKTLDGCGQIAEADSLDVALSRLEEFLPDVVLLDLNLAGEPGLDVLRRSRELSPVPLVVVVTAYGNEKVAVEAMKAGAYDYLAKPFDIDDLRFVIRNALEQVRLSKENRRLRHELERAGGLGEMVGTSGPLRLVYSMIEKVAPTDATVLITGESGSGKELVAREIHRLSPRSAGPLVVVNCAAVPENLIESELFGHEKGAFTGALQRRIGKFEEAQSGTVFLDEIGDMPLGTQAKILRVLEDRKLERLGTNRPLEVDVRIISATNRDLRQMTEDNSFRSDLFYRLEVIRVHVPPLRERPEDIPALLAHFLDRFGERHSRPGVRFSSEALRILLGYPFPGNVRQLRNLVERLVVLSGPDPITLDDLPEEIRGYDVAASGSDSAFASGRLLQLDFRTAREAFERTYLVRKLRDHDGNITRTAEAVGMLRQSLQQKIKDLELRKWMDPSGPSDREL
jgi:DNA-binding NtrC family response regulator